MARSKRLARGPLVETVEPGTYHWCDCGLSSAPPFCDGHHETIDGAPGLRVVIEKEEVIAWCTCRATSRPPFCDGTHKACWADLSL